MKIEPKKKSMKKFVSIQKYARKQRGVNGKCLCLTYSNITTAMLVNYKKIIF